MILLTRAFAIRAEITKASSWSRYSSFPDPKVITVMSWSLLHCGSCVGFVRRGAITSKSRLVNNNMDLFLNGSLRVGRGIPGGSMVIDRKWSLVLDIPTEVSLPNEVYNLIFEVVAFLRIMYVLLDVVVPLDWHGLLELRGIGALFARMLIEELAIGSSLSVEKRLRSLVEVEWVCPGTYIGRVCSGARLELLLLKVCRGVLHECLIRVGVPEMAPPVIKSVSRLRWS
ncbi:hypothetical protein BHE74_00018707 [Ensete ventricosum]|nr:hypothetical protein BHE74_00018707 [Ensete ventricosum]